MSVRFPALRNGGNVYGSCEYIVQHFQVLAEREKDRLLWNEMN